MTHANRWHTKYERLLYDGCMAKARRRSTGDEIGTVRAVGYIRVSTEQQAQSGLSMEHQRRQIEVDCERLGFELVEVYVDAAKTGKNADRAGYQAALTRLMGGEADALMYTEGDRMTRDLQDWLNTVNLSQFYGFRLYDAGREVDVASANGFMLAGIKAVVAQAERMKIAERTKAALAAKKAQGIRLGRPVALEASSSVRVHELRQGGLSMAAIAERLNAESVATATGGRWHASTVRNVLTREAVAL